jgi:hypothetical protein
VSLKLLADAVFGLLRLGGSLGACLRILLKVMGLLSTHGNVPLRRDCCELATAVLTLNSIVWYTLYYLPRLSWYDGSSELCRVNLPFRVQFLIDLVVGELSLGCFQESLMFFIQSSLLLSIKFLSSFHENLLADKNVLVERSFLSKSAATMRTLLPLVIFVNFISHDSILPFVKYIIIYFFLTMLSLVSCFLICAGPYGLRLILELSWFELPSLLTECCFFSSIFCWSCWEKVGACCVVP